MKSSITILVVDDEMMMRNILEKILVRDGYNVLMAENSQQALEIMGNEKVDIIISDMKMPQMNGFE